MITIMIMITMGRRRDMARRLPRRIKVDWQF